MEMVWGPTPGPIDDEGVVAAYPWPDGRRWVRAMMVTTLDGAAVGPDGLSGTISGDADRLVFDAVRRRAEAVLIGASTMRDERYGPMVAGEGDTATVLAILSGTLDLPWEEKVFTDSTVPPLVLTGPSPDADALATAREHVEVLTLPDTEPATLLDALAERGLQHVVCEGGPTLLEAIVRDGLLDEADITVSPVFAGAGRTPGKPLLEETHRLRLVHLLTQDGFVMGRYVKEAE